MKRRTFLMTLGLFLLFFYIGIFVISITAFKNTVNRVKDRSLNEHYFIVSAFMKDLSAVNSRVKGIHNKECLNSLLQPYSYLISDEKNGLALYKEDEIVYTIRFTKVFKNNYLEAPEGEKRQVYIREDDGHTYVIVTGKLPKECDIYTMVYLYDMTDDINSWKQMNNTLFLAGVILSCLLALALLILLNQLFKPLYQISRTSLDIAAGAYETRLLVSGNDELAKMARSFNHMAEEIQCKITELIDNAEKKQQFIDNFAHELRTPMTAIYGYAEYMQKAVMTEDDRLSSLDYIMSETLRLQKIAHELLELANLRNNKISWDSCRISDILKSVRQTLSSKISEKQIHIRFDNDFDNIRGDSCLLESLFMNLINNAISACDSGGHIFIHATEDNGMKTISIQDDGKGMTAEVLNQITEPFYRGEKSRNRRDGGAGLGLAICNQIVRCHNARLDFESSPGEGTTAKVIFTTP